MCDSKMERAKQIAKENKDVEVFIRTADDKDFYARFPAWFGSRESFKYEQYKTGITERRVLASGPYDSPIFTARNARRAYKIGMAKMQADLEAVRIRIKQQKEEKEKEKSENTSSIDPSFTSDPYRIRDCTRCLFVERGMIFISDSIICSCKVKFTPTLEVQQEPEKKDVTIISEKEYLPVLAISTALCTMQDTPATQEDEPLTPLVKARKIADKRIPKEQTSHKCSAENILLAESRHIKLKQSFQSTDILPVEEHTLIYAPSGFGKTTLQTEMMRSGIAIADTDDCPGLTLSRVEQILKTTSVLTNRMDITNEYTGSKILFIPKTPKILEEKTKQFRLDPDDYQYWYKEHTNMTKNSQSIVCEVDKTFLTDWFYHDYGDIRKFNVDMSDLERRIDYGEKYQQGTIIYERWKTKNTSDYMK